MAGLSSWMLPNEGGALLHDVGTAAMTMIGDYVRDTVFGTVFQLCSFVPCFFFEVGTLCSSWQKLWNGKVIGLGEAPLGPTVFHYVPLSSSCVPRRLWLGRQNFRERAIPSNGKESTDVELGKGIQCMLFHKDTRSKEREGGGNKAWAEWK